MPSIPRLLSRLKPRLRWYRLFERLSGGGRLRERMLLGLLGYHYRTLFRRQWVLADRQPHFFSHRIGIFELAYGNLPRPMTYGRGFYAAEMIREGDTVLDIGCGDGFFTRRFYAPAAHRVLAIDVEPSAIAEASRYNAAANIEYRVADAVACPWAGPYDVIVWDGALGHFSPDITSQVLQKIAAHLKPTGVFVGSESLGRDGADHLQFFDEASLRCLLREHFPNVRLKVAAYSLDYDTAILSRQEAYWRCSFHEERIQSGWE